MKETRKSQKQYRKTAHIALTDSDGRAIEAIVGAGWATNTTTAIRFALKLTSERVAAGSAS